MVEISGRREEEEISLEDGKISQQLEEILQEVVENSGRRKEEEFSLVFAVLAVAFVFAVTAVFAVAFDLAVTAVFALTLFAFKN
ncbi:hypothetical protein AXG93_1160s1100 [Marchantia polymorpha subsp. ruderalis]|uniref:Uncharacterized protein n=1 Tax=Marchantia polymorpha subsp. ruderalis TaxID=1480154 RepID=A0A176VLF0_MARPO|nr:hypothetical protein AXG93_1160s1100 [Marchantia polymorpha subsp. ruderalis]